MSPELECPYVIDVSRLIWRRWSGRLPTGIDRVCLAYADHFGSRSLAMVQRGNLRFVLGRRDSRKLLRLLIDGENSGFRRRLIGLLAKALTLPRRPDLAGLTYLNIGHTGLDNPGLGPWLRRHGLRPLVLVHDLIPITHPQFCRTGEAERHRRRMLAVLDWSEGVIANSAVTLDSLADFAVQEGRAVPPALVAPLGVDVPSVDPATAVPVRPWFVVVGTIEARKNHAFLLDMWDDLVRQRGDRAPMLVLVGQRGWEADHVFVRLDSAQAKRGGIVELGTCRDGELGAYLKGARALLMPSLAEGFGLPVAEALALGTPVVATDLPVYREYAGSIPLYLPASDADLWRKAICDLVDNDGENRRQRSLAATYRPPDWPGHFALVEDWLGRPGQP